VALGQVFSENFGFLCQSTFHLLLHNHLHYHWNNRPGVAAVPIASQSRIKKKKYTALYLRSYNAWVIVKYVYSRVCLVVYITGFKLRGFIICRSARHEMLVTMTISRRCCRLALVWDRSKNTIGLVRRTILNDRILWVLK
jgi:hypothetical protein